MVENKVFISYASSDYRDMDGHVIKGNAISEIIKVLDDNHIKRWIDESGLISSKGWCHQIENAINECNIFLYVSSVNANSSANTANEIAYAIEHNKHIIPFKLDKSEYHKDVRLHLIRIHYLRYYEGRDKSLRDLISTIKSIKTSSVILETSVKLKEVINEEQVDGQLLSEIVLSIFNTKDLDGSAKEFKKLEKILNCDSESGFGTLDNYLNRLQKVASERNYNVRKSRIERLVSDIKEDVSTTERCVAIMLVLLKMYLYFYLDDIREVVIIQKEIDEIKFELSYIERNADTINDTANVVIRGATFIASVVATMMGKGGSAGKAGLVASTRGEKITIVKSSQAISNRAKVFETLKLAVQRLVFVEG